MPPRASTSKLASEGPSSLSRSPSASAPPSASVGRVHRAQDGDQDMDMDAMDDEHGDSDEDELDEDDDAATSATAARGKTAKRAASRSSKQRSATTTTTTSGSTSASASVAAGQSPQDYHHSTSNNSNPNVTGNVTSTTSGGGLSKEEIALADRRRRNRETQRAIRKKKANRLQDAELKVSLFESELESLKLKNRDLELEVLNLKRELEDWRLGRIHVGPSIAVAPHQSRILISGKGEDERNDSYRRRFISPEEQPYARQSSSQHRYQSYDIPTEDGKVLGKRRQSFDVTHPPQQSPRHHARDGASPPNPSINRGISLDRRESLSPARKADGPAYELRQSASVLQPVPTMPHGRLTPNMEYAAQQASERIASRPAALDTYANDGGSYGSSDPSPSSAGTVVPSYTSAFNPGPGEAIPLNASSALVNEAVQAIRAQAPDQASLQPSGIPAIISRENVPRSHSIPSTTSTSISDKVSSSYDDYHEFWTSSASNSASQSQCDSLTSMSSYYSRTASSSAYPAPHGAMVHPYGPGADKQAVAQGSVAADGMILSMSRSSLCASPLSIAEEKDESMYQHFPVADVEHISRDAGRGKVQEGLDLQRPAVKPSLPSLSASLKRDHYGEASTSPDRIASLPPPAGSMAGSPPASYIPSFRSAYPVHPHHHHHAQPHRTSPGSHSHTLPPISSAFSGSRQATLPPISGGSSEVPHHNKPLLTTRNGRGKTTSYPLFSGPGTAEYAQHDPSTRNEQSKGFNWPGPASTTSATRPMETSSFGGPILPLPRRASARPPLSSTRDDSSMPIAKEQRIEEDYQVDEGQSKIASETVIMSPSEYDEHSAIIMDNDKEVVEGNKDIIEHSNSDKRLPRRRKSTYEDFVELFGSQGTA